MPASPEPQHRQLQLALHDAARWAYGVVFAEVWVFNSRLDGPPVLERPDEGGWWVDPVYHSRCHQGDECRFCRLTDSDRDDYIPPPPLCPGEGLPGMLWQEIRRSGRRFRNGVMWSVGGGGSWGGGSSARSSRGGSVHSRQRKTRVHAEECFDEAPPARPPRSPPALDSDSEHGSMRQENDSPDEENPTFPLDRPHRLFAPPEPHRRQSRIAWRNIRSVADDPDQPFSPRIHVIAYEMNLGWVAGLPFHVYGHSGIVLYFTRDTVDEFRLQSPGNEYYLLTATAAIGAACAVQGSREMMMHERQADSDRALRKVREKILLILRTGSTLPEYIANQACSAGRSHGHSLNLRGYTPPSPTHDLRCAALLKGSGNQLHWCRDLLKLVRRKAMSIAKKCRGGTSQAPPVFGWNETLHTFVGTFINMGLLSSLNSLALEHAGEDYVLALP
jgi:hypothetical protein